MEEHTAIVLIGIKFQFTLYVLIDFFLDDLRNGCGFIYSSAAAVCYQFIVLNDMHIPVVIVLIESVKSTFIAD